MHKQAYHILKEKEWDISATMKYSYNWMWYTNTSSTWPIHNAPFPKSLHLSSYLWKTYASVRRQPAATQALPSCNTTNKTCSTAGVAWSKTTMFLCFQFSQIVGIRMVMKSLEPTSTSRESHPTKVLLACGIHSTCPHAVNTWFHTMHAKTQPRSWWSMQSGNWSHSRQASWCWSTQCTSRPEVSTWTPARRSIYSWEISLSSRQNLP